MQTNVNDSFLSRKELADRYGIAVKTIAQWASKGTGPPYYVIGGAARYRLVDVIAWEAQQLRNDAPKNVQLCENQTPPR
jgi:predicted DNA-binding transcriptional regulator AlpA